MLTLNLPLLQRKYPGSVVENNRIKIPVSPETSGLNIYLEEGIWRIKPQFLDQITVEVINALGLTPGTNEASQVRRRVIILPNNIFLFEFLHKDFNG